MFKFAKPNREPFDLHYMGPIFAFDSGNDLVAICYGGTTWFEKAIETGILTLKEDGSYDFTGDFFESGTIGEPDKWEEWEVVIKVSGKKRIILQRALATAYCATSLCERLIIK